jgi:hypothetical protein
MRFKEIASRITGFSVPVFGVSWNPPEPEAAVARRVLALLEDRRVLFNPYHLEVADQCVDSVLQIRQKLTDEIGRLPEGSKIAEHLRAIRAACRKFLDSTNPSNHSRRIMRPHWHGPFESGFFADLGELRATIGLHVAAIAVMYGVDVEGELASTLPAQDKDAVKQQHAAAVASRRR